jgi:hypothetical protein
MDSVFDTRPIAYRRRLDLANQLVEENGRDDWAIRLGMITPERKTISRVSRDFVRAWSKGGANPRTFTSAINVLSM